MSAEPSWIDDLATALPTVEDGAEALALEWVGALPCMVCGRPPTRVEARVCKRCRARLRSRTEEGRAARVAGGYGSVEAVLTLAAWVEGAAGS
jgi:hypothetical protein